MVKIDAPMLRLVRKGSLGRARISNQWLLRKGREGSIFFGLSGLLATSGKHCIIPEGSPVTAYVEDDIELQAMVPKLP